MEEKIDFLKVDETERLTDIFKMLSDPTRLRIFHILAQKSMHVDELKDALNMNQSAVSHQLRALRDVHLVVYEKRGKYSYYSLADNHVLQIYKQALEHVREAC